MHETLTTAAMLLVPFLAVVVVGAVAVAVHDAIERAWVGGRASVGSVASEAETGRRVAPRGSGSRGVRPVLARSGAASRRPDRRAPVVLVR